MIGKEKVSQMIYLGTLYFISVGILYLWGYWGSFDINTLEFLTLSDIIKIAIYSNIFSFILLALGAIVGELSSWVPIRKLFSERGWRNTRVIRFLNRHAQALRLIFIFLIILLFLLEPPAKWLILAVLLGIPIYRVIKRSGFLQNLILNGGTKAVIIYLFAVLPLFSYGWGKLEANDILEGKKFKYVSPKLLKDSASPLNLENQKYLKFIGHVSNYVFLQREDNKRILILSTEKISALALHKNKKGRIDTTMSELEESTPFVVSKPAPLSVPPRTPRSKAEKPGR